MGLSLGTLNIQEEKKITLPNANKLEPKKNLEESKFEANNELTHTANQNCASASCGEEEQKPSLVEEVVVGRCALGPGHAWGGGGTCRCQCQPPKPQYVAEWSGMQ